MKSFLTAISLLIIWAAITTAAPAPSPAPRYSITHLGLLPGTNNSVPTDINDAGQVVGYGGTRSDYGDLGPTRALLFQNGAVIDLGPGRAVSINNRGQIVGNNDDGVFLYENGAMTNLGKIGTARAINDKGQIVGGWPSFLYEKGKVTPLDHGKFRANAINNKGQIVGIKDVPVPIPGRKSNTQHAILFQGGKVIDLGALNNIPAGLNKEPHSEANAINDRGQIVGQTGYRYAPSPMDHAAIFSNGRVIDLFYTGRGQTPYDDVEETSALDINNHGQIVGSYTYVPYQEDDFHYYYHKAFVVNGGHVAFLENFLPASSGVTLKSANAINDNGQIVCEGSTDAILLAPLVTVAITGKSTYTTSQKHVHIKGTATGSIPVTKVKYRIGASGPYRSAVGTKHWHFNPSLKLGDNVITIIARGPNGESAPVKATITRRSN